MCRTRANSSANLSWNWTFMNEKRPRDVSSLSCNVSQKAIGDLKISADLRCNIGDDLFSDMTSLMFSMKLVPGWWYIRFRCYDVVNGSNHKDIYLIDTRKICLYSFY